MNAPATDTKSLERESAHRPPSDEPLPSWLEHELSVGRDKLPELRSALIKAQLACSGLIHQTRTNQEQHYKYTGHEDVIEHVREAMSSNGLSVEQVTCDLEEAVFYGNVRDQKEAWKWRAVCLVTHVSGASVVRIVRTLTVPNNKAAGVASTAVERTLLMRLMRLAGTKEDPEDAGNDRPQGNGQSARGAPDRSRPASNGTSKSASNGSVLHDQAKLLLWIDARVKTLLECSTAPLLILWARVFCSQPVPKNLAAAAWDDWGKACGIGGFSADALWAEAKKLGPLAEDMIVVRQSDGVLVHKQTGEVLA